MRLPSTSNSIKPFTIPFLLACLALALCSCILNAAPAYAGRCPITVVENDSFAPSGYNWHFNFEGVTSERGFAPVSNVSAYYTTSYAQEILKDSDDGFAAFITSTTNVMNGSDYRFALRYTNGTYTDENGEDHLIDAIVSLTNWEYKEYSGGFLNDPYLKKYPPKIWKSGVFIDNDYSPNADERKQTSITPLENLNFFTVELANLQVEILFVEAGTNTPIQVKGHATCVDIDNGQKFSSYGGVYAVEVSESSQEIRKRDEPWLQISEDGKQVLGTGGIEADDSDQNYQRGMATVYFDTGADGTNAVGFNFITSLSGTNWTSVSFFDLTSEYLANPPRYEMTLTKTASTEFASLDEEYSYKLSTLLPKEGVDVRIGYRLPTLVMRDSLPDELELVGTPIVILDGKVLGSSSYSYTYKNNQVEVAMSNAKLQSIQLNGQRLTVKLTVKAKDFPESDEDGRYPIINEGEMQVFDDDIVPSNPMTIYLIPDPRNITVTKRIPASAVYWQHGYPGFIITLSGTDFSGREIVKRALIGFSPNSTQNEDGFLEASYTFQNIPCGTYSVTEIKAVRYKQVSLETSGLAQDGCAHLNLYEDEDPFVVFTNQPTYYAGGSDTNWVVNHLEP